MKKYLMFVVCGLALMFLAGCLAEGIDIKADKIDTKGGGVSNVTSSTD
jgi:hypothetical protein|tara:strand:- start:837 stop:980 length:144 start_codon:yes stop_codon:yes gene_type:complete